MGKVVWIVNEYNGPKGIRTRQTVLSQRLRERGYEVFLICGSSDFRGGENAIQGKVLPCGEYDTYQEMKPISLQEALQ